MAAGLAGAAADSSVHRGWASWKDHVLGSGTARGPRAVGHTRQGLQASREVAEAPWPLPAIPPASPSQAPPNLWEQRDPGDCTQRGCGHPRKVGGGKSDTESRRPGSQPHLPQAPRALLSGPGKAAAASPCFPSTPWKNLVFEGARGKPVAGVGVAWACASSVWAYTSTRLQRWTRGTPYTCKMPSSPPSPPPAFCYWPLNFSCHTRSLVTAGRASVIGQNPLMSTGTLQRPDTFR